MEHNLLRGKLIKGSVTDRTFLKTKPCIFFKNKIDFRLCREKKLQSAIYSNAVFINIMQGHEVACVASVSVGLGNKESQRNGIFGVLPAPSFPSPTPSFVFWLSLHFSRGKNTENPVPRSFFAPKRHGNACYAG